MLHFTFKSVSSETQYPIILNYTSKSNNSVSIVEHTVLCVSKQSIK